MNETGEGSHETKRSVFGMSGIEFHRQLPASGSSTPVIYITAHDEPASREQAEAAGCAAYFRKTDPGQDVLQAIRRAVQPRVVEPT